LLPFSTYTYTENERGKKEIKMTNANG